MQKAFLPFLCRKKINWQSARPHRGKDKMRTASFHEHWDWDWDILSLVDSFLPLPVGHFSPLFYHHFLFISSFLFSLFFGALFPAEI
jgi:hypothetical protein